MSRLRLLGGAYGGRILEVPGSARPSGGRLREALFSMWGPALVDARVLDLFAGSGAVALEALGRGARLAVAVERDRRALGVLRRNAGALDARELEIVRDTVPPFGSWSAGRTFDLAFADPPYSFEGWEELLDAVGPHLAEGGELACESRRPIPVPGGWRVRGGERRYGDSRLTRLERSH